MDDTLKLIGALLVVAFAVAWFASLAYLTIWLGVFSWSASWADVTPWHTFIALLLALSSQGVIRIRK